MNDHAAGDELTRLLATLPGADRLELPEDLWGLLDGARRPRGTWGRDCAEVEPNQGVRR